ncbi:MAG: hypothetical protein ABGY75_03355 [Gemmataceae bacterium]
MFSTSATPNRVAPYLSESKKTLPLPATREGREAVLADAVFAAIAALQGLLTHADPKVVMKAAEMILNLETTRQRHGRTMIGMEHHVGRVESSRPDGEAMSGLEDSTRPTETDLLNDLPDEPDDALIEVVRSGLQEDADAKGTGEVVSWTKAKQAARDGLAFLRQQACGTGPASPTVASTGIRRPPPLPRVAGERSERGASATAPGEGAEPLAVRRRNQR